MTTGIQALSGIQALVLQIPERKPKKENEKVEFVKELVVEDKETQNIEVRELENEKDEIEPSGIQALVLENTPLPLKDKLEKLSPSTKNNRKELH